MTVTDWARVAILALLIGIGSALYGDETLLGNGSEHNGYVAGSGGGGKTLSFTDTDLVFADQDSIPETGWIRRKMPPIWLSDEARSQQQGALVAWARFRFDRSKLPDVPLSIFTENNRERVVIFVNGIDIYRNYRDERSATLGWNHPYMVPLPKQLLRDGTNEVILRVSSHQQFSLGVGSMMVGPQSFINKHYAYQYFWRISGAQSANYAMLIFTIIVFIMWLGRRHEMEFFWLSLTGLFWFIRDFHFFTDEAVGNPYIFQQITYYSLYFAVASSLSFCASFLRMTHSKRIIQFMFGVGILLCLFRLLILQSSRTDLATSLFTLVLSYGFIIAMFRSWLKTRSTEHFLLFSVVLMTSLFGLHDIGRIPNIQWWDGLGFHVQPYTGFLLFLVFLYSLGHRYLRALGAVELLNSELEDRVQKATSALALSEAARRKLQIERAIESERERLMREMHDGIGSNLVTALAIARRNNHTSNSIVTLERALADLKITVDSLAPVDGDVVTLLANLRHRLQPDLSKAGIKCIWLVEPCPNLAWLDAANALHMLRIIQEAVSNVLVHSGASEIVIACKPESIDGRDGISIFVADNGCGFSQPEDGSGHGVSNMRARAAVLHARFALTSSPETGSKVELWLPLAK